jgi:hypothetical protein
MPNSCTAGSSSIYVGLNLPPNTATTLGLLACARRLSTAIAGIERLSLVTNCSLRPPSTPPSPIDFVDGDFDSLLYGLRRGACRVAEFGVERKQDGGLFGRSGGQTEQHSEQ